MAHRLCLKLKLKPKLLARIFRAARLGGYSVKYYLERAIDERVTDAAMRQRWVFTGKLKDCVLKKHPHSGDCLDKRGRSLWEE